MTTAVIQYFALAALVVSLTAAAVSDVQRYLIPNRYPAAIAISYMAFAVGQPIEQTLWGFAAGFLMLAAAAAMFAFRIVGGGDAKLLAATMLWAGPGYAPTFLFVTALAGGALGLVWLTPVRHLVAAPEAQSARLGLTARLRNPTPYGVAIAAGGFWLAAMRAFH